VTADAATVRRTGTQDAATAPARNSRSGDRRATAVSHVVLVIWSIVVLLPLLWALVSSFKTTNEILSSPFTLPKALSFANYVSAWDTAGIGTSFFNTVIVVGCSLVLVMVLGAMCSYVLARFQFFGNRAIYYLMLAGLTFPVFLAFALPFTVFFLFAFFKSLPDEIYEAAQMDGAGEWRTFFQVMLPMARPGMASVAIFNFLGLWNQFLLPVALNTDPAKYVLSQGMASFASQAGYSVDYGALFAAVVITVLPVLIVYIIFQRQLQGSVAQGTSR
jgi:N-acetylglucosamine transport system permease protein